MLQELIRYSKNGLKTYGLVWEVPEKVTKTSRDIGTNPILEQHSITFGYVFSQNAFLLPPAPSLAQTCLQPSIWSPFSLHVCLNFVSILSPFGPHVVSIFSPFCFHFYGDIQLYLVKLTFSITKPRKTHAL